MSTATETTRVQRRVRLEQDENPESPREWDNLGHMVCWHKRYTLGDEQPKQDPQEWFAQFQEDNPGALTLPLYLMDHSGISMRTNSTGFQACDPQRWDWGQVGWIVMSRAQIVKEYGDDGTDGARACLAQEVETYDQFLQGDVWVFICEEGAICSHGDTHWEHVDSCGGFYGRDVRTNGMMEHMPSKLWKDLLLQEG
mgnify:CR=1 FL=1